MLSYIRTAGCSRHFLKCRNGSSAVEFALVAPLFLALVFSILEAGYFFFVESAVEAANAKAARLIRTGQAQTNAISREAFFGEICDVVKLFGDCNERLTVDVVRFSSFAALAADARDPVCRDADPDAVDAIPYQAGASRDIVRVRVCYLHKSFNPGLGLNLQKAKGGSVKMFSTSIFRNEPYDS
jgi:Flp pilus assembly protein TadG